MPEKPTIYSVLRTPVGGEGNETEVVARVGALRPQLSVMGELENRYVAFSVETGANI